MSFFKAQRARWICSKSHSQYRAQNLVIEWLHDFKFCAQNIKYNTYEKEEWMRNS